MRAAGVQNVGGRSRLSIYISAYKMRADNITLPALFQSVSIVEL